MAVSLEKRRAIRNVAGPVLGVALTAYFAFSAFEGERGVLRIIQLDQEIVRAEQTLASVTAEREHLDRYVEALRDERLDADYLDERARIVTGLIASGDVVISDTGTRRRFSMVGGPPTIRR